MIEESAKKKGRQNNKGATFREAKFTVHTEEFNNEIYDLTYNMRDQYMATTRDISEQVSNVYPNGLTFNASIEEMTAQVLHTPITPTQPNTLEHRIWEREVDKNAKQKNILTMNLKTLYSLIWGKSTPALRAKLCTYAVLNIINAE